ncbi:hypothetical protein J7337_006954 [Fusarium musae]|uniref:Uncharacterized protein n=1 Tax=Fusarium musae TaxID=1042133 RepID=A0A9P8DG09_9HYPO|nr:hypothetical protein J7337_006954 [Fusarium musae]KAG9501270.1 hypothetical protein J7337_006954 [Fusarium musae]
MKERMKSNSKKKLEPEIVPKSALGEGVALLLKITHDVAPVFSTWLDVLKETDEDVFVDVGIPLHDLTFGHGDDNRERIEKGPFEDVEEEEEEEEEEERSLLSVVEKLRRREDEATEDDLPREDICTH